MSKVKANGISQKGLLHVKECKIDFCLQNFLKSGDKVIVNQKSLRTKADSIATSDDAVNEEFNVTVVLDNLTSEWRMAEVTSDHKTRVNDTGHFDKLQHETNVQVHCQTKLIQL